MKKTILFIILGIGLYILLNAEAITATPTLECTIKGKVVDAYIQTPIKFAKVCVAPMQATQENCNYVNPTGEFTVKYSGLEIGIKIIASTYFGKQYWRDCSGVIDLGVIELNRLTPPKIEAVATSPPSTNFAGIAITYYRPTMSDIRKDIAQDKGKIAPSRDNIEDVPGMLSECTKNSECPKNSICFGGICYSQDLCQETDGVPGNEGYNNPFKKNFVSLAQGIINIGIPIGDACACFDYSSTQGEMYRTNNCAKYTHVEEYSCFSTPLAIECKNGCKDGACVSECKDSRKGDTPPSGVEVKGDWCYDTELIENSYCENEVCCDNRNPNLFRRAGKVIAQTTGIGNEREFCEQKGICKDDFILVKDGKETDCWNEDAMCVPEKNECVKFEDMGWNKEILENVKKLKEAYPTSRDALYKLGNLNAKEIESIIIKILIKYRNSFMDSDFAANAARMLGKFKSENSLSVLIESIDKSGYLDVKMGALSALGEIGSDKAVPTLKETLNKKEFNLITESASSFLLNYEAADALKKIGSPLAVQALLDTMVESKDFKIIKLAILRLIALGKYHQEIAKRILDDINNNVNSAPPVRFNEYAVLINLVHDMENRREDFIRKTIINSLDNKSAYYLLSLGGPDLYTSTFELLYEKITRNPNFLNNIKTNIDPDQRYTLEFILTLANYNKLKEIIVKDPRFFMGSIKGAMQEKGTYRLRVNGILLVSTINAIFNEPQLSQFKPEIETFLLEQYEKSQKSTIQQAIFGYNIKLNKDKFSEKNKQKAIEISSELPELFEPTVPEEWLKDNKLTAKLYFTQEGQLSRTRDQSFNKFFEFKVIEQKEKTSIMTLNPNSLLTDGRSNGKYNGVELQVILTEDLSDVQEAVNNYDIDIVSHRGHSFSELNVFSPSVQSQQRKLIFLGGCGGFGRIAIIQETLPYAYYVSDENLGQGDVNDRVLFYIMRSIALRKNQNIIQWSEVEQDVIDSYKRINSPFPSGIVFPHHKSLLLNSFIRAVIKGIP